MTGKKHSPAWWLLYLSLPLMFGLFWIEFHLTLSETGHWIAELVIFLGVLRYMFLWLRYNAGAIIYYPAA